MPTKQNLMGAGCAPLQAVASMGFVSGALTAVGSTQGTALVLPSDFNIITTAAASTGVILPASSANYQVADTVIVVNHGANAILVYPQTGGKIGVGATNAGLSVGSGKTGTFTLVDATSGANIWASQVSA